MIATSHTVCRYISELWLYAFLKLRSKSAPNSFYAQTISIFHRYPQPTTIPSFKSDFLSLSAHRFPNPSVQTPYQPVFSSNSPSLLPICLFSFSDTALAFSLAHSTKIHPWLHSSSSHNRHICHISCFHHCSLDLSFTISDLFLCGIVWRHYTLKYTARLHGPNSKSH